MKKNLPQGLLQKQEAERTATVTAVTDAIIELESQGYNTRIKDIIFVTGLSRSVFAKPHIRQILVEYGIVDPVEIKSVAEGKVKRNIEVILAEKDGYIQRLLAVNEQLRQECEILRGQIHVLSHKNHAMDNNDF